MKKLLTVATLALALVSVANFAEAQTKKVVSAYCYIPQTQQKVLGRSFFSEVHNISQRSPNICVVGKIAAEPFSDRIYLNGSRLAKYSGSLSNSEVKGVERAYGCVSMTYTCVETNSPF